MPGGAKNDAHPSTALMWDFTCRTHALPIYNFCNVLGSLSSGGIATALGLVSAPVPVHDCALRGRGCFLGVGAYGGHVPTSAAGCDGRGFVGWRCKGGYAGIRISAWCVSAVETGDENLRAAELTGTVGLSCCVVFV